MALEMEIFFFLSRGTLQTEGRDIFPRMLYKSVANAHIFLLRGILFLKCQRPSCCSSFNVIFI